MTILGTRPEVIKLAPVIKELEKTSSMSRAANPYGDGKATQRIVRILLSQSRKK